MKKISKVLAVPMFIIGAFLITVSCQDDDDQVNPVSNPAQINSAMQAGSWRISRFVDSGQDETQHFAGYTFTFHNSGLLTATNGANTYEGSWRVTNDDDDDDDSPSGPDFNINFNLTNDFEDLNDDWDIQNYASSQIELIDISGGNGGTDYLTFVKN